MDGQGLTDLLAYLRDAQDESSKNIDKTERTEEAGESSVHETERIPSRSHTTGRESSENASASDEKNMDRVHMDFRRALELLDEMKEDPSFIAQLRQIRKEQFNAEKRLLGKRKSQLQQRGITEVMPAVREAVRAIDVEIWNEWAAVNYRQQRQLERLGVPTFTQTRDPVLLSRQQRMISVLNMLADDGGDFR